MAAVVSQVGAVTGIVLGGINLPRRVAGASQAARLLNSPCLMTRRAGRVRCEAGGEGSKIPTPKTPTPTPTPGLAGSFDRATKNTITKEEVLQNQATNESEQRSIFGAKPTPGSVYGRPEVERRPETGDLSPWSVFAFDGAAPETINGRLAMLGFVWALIGEKATGLSVIDQVLSPGSTGLIWFLASVQIFTYASLVPIFNAKESTDARSFGPFTAKAERWNGRAAMIGFFSLIVTEFFLQGPILRLFANSVVPPV